jgi:hypothetical protein
MIGLVRGLVGKIRCPQLSRAIYQVVYPPVPQGLQIAKMPYFLPDAPLVVRL